MIKRFIPEFTEQELALIEEAWGGKITDFRRLSEKEGEAFELLKERKIIKYNSIIVGDEYFAYVWWITPHGELLLTLRQSLLELQK